MLLGQKWKPPKTLVAPIVFFFWGGGGGGGEGGEEGGGEEGGGEGSHPPALRLCQQDAPLMALHGMLIVAPIIPHCMFRRYLKTILPWQLK